MKLNMLLGMFGLGGPEITLIVVIVLLMFGGKKIPELAKGIGKGIKDFKDSYNGAKESEDPEKKNDTEAKNKNQASDGTR
jgi:sec-independent protein translocase protein TatA